MAQYFGSGGDRLFESLLEQSQQEHREQRLRDLEHRQSQDRFDQFLTERRMDELTDRLRGLEFEWQERQQRRW